MLKRLDQFCHVIPLASMLLTLAGDAIRYSGLCLWPSYTLAAENLLQVHRHRWPKPYHVVACPILGGLHHDYIMTIGLNRRQPDDDIMVYEREERDIMARVVEALYENGTLKPLETLYLPEHQRVRITIHEPIVESPDEMLEAWQQVYEGCAKEDITRIEAIGLDRSRSMRQEP
jgi:predicted DNA-binding antitoxin AbrB/MazE fold protein